MSSTTQDLIFQVAPASESKPSPIWEVLAMVGDAVAPAPAARSRVERVEAVVFQVLFAAAVLVTSYGLSFAW